MLDLCDRSFSLYRVGKVAALFSLPDACLGIETSIFQPDVSSGRSYQVVKVRRNLLGNVSSFLDFCLRRNKITDRQRCTILCTALFSVFYRKSYFFQRKNLTNYRFFNIDLELLYVWFFSKHFTRNFIVKLFNYIYKQINK